MEEEELGIFEEPEGFFRAADPSSFAFYQRIHNEKLTLRLLGQHPLWGHMLWNAGVVMAEWLDDPKNVGLKDRSVLELGAGSGLPSIIAGLRGGTVVATDYPDEPLLENLRHNIELNSKDRNPRPNIIVRPHLWGKEPELLLQSLKSMSTLEYQKFDYIIISDCIFNHHCHTDLLATCSQCLSPQGKIFVTFTHHRPKYAQKDLAFFQQALDSFGFKTKKLFSKKIKPMFEGDEGPEDIRATVHMVIMEWNK